MPQKCIIFKRERSEKIHYFNIFIKIIIEIVKIRWKVGVSRETLVIIYRYENSITSDKFSSRESFNKP